MKPFVIKNEEQYDTALAYVEQLMDAEPGSPEEAELDVWATLIQLYEDKVHPIPLPDPIEAIKFRMEQSGLKQKDLVPYLGTASRVSEVLSGKRALSLSMMRRLHKGLGIPASSLLGEDDAALPDTAIDIEWGRFPVVEMRKRGWIEFPGSAQCVREHAEDIMRRFSEPFEEDVALPMCARQHVRDGKEMDPYALCAWKIRVMHLATEQEVSPYAPGTVTLDFMREVARLSYFEDGVMLAREYLAKSGIHLLAEKHLPKTYLDGAALIMPDERPLIALTLRYDRLDNFWFTLAHELAHVALHLEGGAEAFFDDLEAGGTSPMERDADRLASDALIPESAWQGARLDCHSTAAQIRALSAELRISPAIVAGRIRHEADDHRILWQLLGKNQVRRVLAT
ncbi:MAG: ImmA/IrrE family metallo-endopeptidase [Lentisphaerae bacterium]|nr:ImmA/IrrE family metallo-endopeptidase [Lentisphaerota bacterium]